MPCRGGADLAWGVYGVCFFFFLKTQATSGFHTRCDAGGDARGDAQGDTRGATRGDTRAHARGNSVAPGISILNVSFPPCYFLPEHHKPAPKTIPESLLRNLHKAKSEDDSRLIRLPVL